MKNIVVNKKFTIILLGTVLLFTGCGNKELEPALYASYFEAHKTELEKSKDFDALTFEANYIPTDVMAIRDQNLIDGKLNPAAFKTAYKKYDDAWYFTFKIKPSSSNTSIKNIIQTKENYSKIKQYLSGMIIKDFKIEFDSEKINCNLVNVESDISVQNCFLFIMSFEKPYGQHLLAKDITLVYEDNMFQNGILKFNFSKDRINNFPKIKVI